MIVESFRRQVSEIFFPQDFEGFDRSTAFMVMIIMMLTLAAVVGKEYQESIELLAFRDTNMARMNFKICREIKIQTVSKLSSTVQNNRSHIYLENNEDANKLVEILYDSPKRLLIQRAPFDFDIFLEYLTLLSGHSVFNEVKEDDKFTIVRELKTAGWNEFFPDYEKGSPFPK